MGKIKKVGGQRAVSVMRIVTEFKIAYVFVLST